MGFLKKRNAGTATMSTTAPTSGVAKMAFGIPLILLTLAAWAVALAGVSVVRHDVGEAFPIDSYGDLSFTWFVVFGSLFVLLFTLISLIGDRFSALPSGHAAMSGLLAVMTTLAILETQKWNSARKATGPPYKTQLSKGIVTAFSGFLSMSALMGILIIVLGSQTNARINSHPHHHNDYAAPVGTVPAHTQNVHPSNVQPVV